MSVLTLLRTQDRRARVCRRVADHACIRLITQADFFFNGGDGEWLDYPANALHRDEERAIFDDALGSVDPSLSAREYFLVTRSRGPNAPYTVQFWFFYTYNYLETVGALRHDAGLHEGDFETVSFLLSAHSHQPRYVWMARHKDEGRVFSIDEDQLKTIGSGASRRVVIYAAKGSHADYESCADARAAPSRRLTASSTTGPNATSTKSCTWPRRRRTSSTSRASRGRAGAASSGSTPARACSTTSRTKPTTARPGPCGSSTSAG